MVERNYTGPLTLPEPALTPDCFARELPRTVEQRHFDEMLLAAAASHQRRVGLRREWALRQVFMECLTHYREVMMLKRSDAHA